MFSTHFLHHVTVSVSDLDRSRDFYGRVLGLNELPRRGVGVNGAWFQVGPSQVNLLVRKEPAPDASRHFALCVDSIRSSRKSLEAEGMELTKTTRVGNINRFFLNDPDGNRVEIVCPIGQG